MPAKSRARFNRMSVGRAAVLFRRLTREGKDPEQIQKAVAEHYFRKYGTKWGINDVDAMHRYLFQSNLGRRPRFMNMFEDKTPLQIREAYSKWLKRSIEIESQASERMSRLRQNPKFQQRRSERLEELEQDPEFKKMQSERMKRLHRDPVFQKQQRERMPEQMRRLHRDPGFKKRTSERASERIKRLNRDPEFKKKQVEGKKNKQRKTDTE